MSDIIVANMQSKRGRRVDLPQPLNPGEFGFCTDTGQLFIGADPNDPAYPAAKHGQTIQLYTGGLTDAQANTLLSEYIVQIELSGSVTQEDIAVDFFDSIGDFRAPEWEQHIKIKGTDRAYLSYDYVARAEIQVDDTQNVTSVLITNNGYGYGVNFSVSFDGAVIDFTVSNNQVTGYTITSSAITKDPGVYSLPMQLPANPITLPGSVAYSTNYNFFAFMATPAITFSGGEMTFIDNPNYDSEDAGIISELLNVCYTTVDGEQPGVGNLQLNIEVTGAGSIIIPPPSGGVWEPDIEMVPATYTLVESVGSYSNTGISYLTSDSEAYLIEYSVKASSTGPAGNYYRTGVLKATVNLNGTDATLSDNYVVAAPFDTEDFDLSFSAVIDTGSFILKYVTTALADYGFANLTFTVTVRRWKSV